MLMMASKVSCKELEIFLDPVLRLRVDEILTIDPHRGLKLCSITFSDCWRKEDEGEFYDHICGCESLVDNIDRSEEIMRSMISGFKNLVHLVILSPTPFTLSQSLITFFESPVLAMWVSPENETGFDFQLEMFARGCFRSLIGTIHIDIPLISFPRLLKDLVSSRRSWLEKLDVNIEELESGVLIMRSSIHDKALCKNLEHLYEG
jgi:hypothetical protein